MKFKLKSKYKPAGDQPKAIEALLEGLKKGMRAQTLLGITGSGKTFTMANVIAKINQPTLVIAHNKTLAAQLCQEFREFFPENAVHYFVSYYDYYQPEAYIPTSDTYIDKEAMINDEIDRLRHAATQSLLSRRDVIIVASVSCIYGLGAPETYEKINLHLKIGDEFLRDDLIRRLIDMQFERTNSDLTRGHFRLRGDVLEIMPISEEIIYRIEFSALGKNNSVNNIVLIDPVTRKIKSKEQSAWIFPAKHFITKESERKKSLKEINIELEKQLKIFEREGKLLEAERLARRTKNDIEMIRELGYCHGIENYSRHLSGRKAGESPDTLLSYFPKTFLTIIDESHVTIPQIGGMYEGDASRKRTLIEYGFRLPSAADNRPLKFPEFLARTGQMIFTSATPSTYEKENSEQIVEQIIRPTGLIDPKITICPITETEKNLSQVDDLLKRVKEKVEKGERILVTTLTKKMAEDLFQYLHEEKIKANYIHSDVKALDRIKILTDFRRGKFDCLVGVNLLREGLDLPEVTMVAILDADKEGFLRSETALIQTIGRAARNVLGEVILYADNMTGSMRRAFDETERRRFLQLAYNKRHNITPQTIIKNIKNILPEIMETEKQEDAPIKGRNIKQIISEKERQMKDSASRLDFETAAILRDEVRILKKKSRNH
ncbi:excinuclease ABC subunit UvrB [Candidatus Parcubacteria bacterium]|nr:excinuclease ABC subunit UvrB [Patescibacteria group bacterium]MCG2693896.1 excinuclease ABC subunit UvrB [Candidatus Parcubacteria bacterium]